MGQANRCDYIGRIDTSADDEFAGPKGTFPMNVVRSLAILTLAFAVFLPGCKTRPPRSPKILGSFRPSGNMQAPPINSRSPIDVPSAAVAQPVPVVPVQPAFAVPAVQAVPAVPVNPAMAVPGPTAGVAVPAPTAGVAVQGQASGVAVQGPAPGAVAVPQSAQAVPPQATPSSATPVPDLGPPPESEFKNKPRMNPFKKLFAPPPSEESEDNR